MHCKDCIYWKRIDTNDFDENRNSKIEGRCGLFSNGLFANNHYNHEDDSSSDIYQKDKLAQIDSGGEGQFLTSSKFGCNQFKHKRVGVLK